MNRQLAVAAAAVFLLGAVAIWTLRTTDGGAIQPAATPSNAATQRDDLAMVPATTGGIDPEQPASTSPAGPVAPADNTSSTQTEPPTAPAEKSAWAEVPIATRESQLGVQLARPVHEALASARERMTACFDEETTRLKTAPRPRADPNDPPRGPALLNLNLQRYGGGLQIVAADVEYLGTSSEELVSCCRNVLIGVEIPVAAAPAADRYRLKFTVQ